MQNMFQNLLKNDLLHDVAKGNDWGDYRWGKRAQFFAIIADETRDVSRIKQLSLCFQYVQPDDHSVKEQYAHCLNLVVVNTVSSIKSVDVLFGLLEAVYCFITASSLWHDKFVEWRKKHKHVVMEIPKIIDTKWVCRYAAVQLFRVLEPIA